METINVAPNVPFILALVVVIVGCVPKSITTTESGS